MSWYALYCRTGQEKLIIRSCKQHLSAYALEEAFQFSYDRMKKYLGEWHVDTYVMFPNYIFLQSENPEQLKKELRKYQNIVGILENDGVFLQVKPQEEEKMRQLCGERHHMRISRGIVEDGNVLVTDGPLRGRESWVQKFDLHKRVAVLNIKITETGKDIWAGIDIVSGSW